MKTIRKHLKIISTLMTMCVLFISCEKYDSISEINTNEDLNFGKTSTYSGEEIFKGLFFMDNEISDGISQIEDIKSKILKK